MTVVFRKRIISLKEFLYTIPRYIKARFIKARTLGYFDPMLAEKISLEVSMINECKYCFHSHTIVSEFVSKNEDYDSKKEQQGEIMHESKEWLALDYARQYLNEINNMPSMEDIDATRAKLKKKFHPNQIERIETIVFVMNMNNRSMNTIEGFILRLSGKAKPAEESSFVGELVTLLLLSIIAFPRILRLYGMQIRTKIKQKRSSK
jgi:AhpD family alkylhydroperoxidase